MKNRQSWSASAVELFSRMAARVGAPAKPQLDSASWQQRLPTRWPGVVATGQSPGTALRPRRSV